MASIVDGLSPKIDHLLELTVIGQPPQYKHRTHCARLSLIPPSNFDGHKLIDEILNTLEENWQKRVNSKPSEENWVLRQQTNLSGGSRTDTEVPLERVVANLFRLTRDLKNQPSATWGNQVPVASGVVNPKADNRMGIDLVSQRAALAFDLIELKVRSDTPLYAGIEILIYGAVFLFWRLHSHDLVGVEPASNSISLLKGNDLRLAVLAPESYYKPFNLKWFEEAVDTGLQKVLKARSFAGTLKMNFRFESFPEEFVRPAEGNGFLFDFSRSQIYNPWE